MESKVEIGRREKKKGEKDPLPPPCRSRWYPVVTLCESGESLLLVVVTGTGKGDTQERNMKYK